MEFATLTLTHPVHGTFEVGPNALKRARELGPEEQCRLLAEVYDGGVGTEQYADPAYWRAQPAAVREFVLADTSLRADDEETHWVAVYEMDRAYGGSEEGGWWYDCGDRVERCKVRTYPSEAAARSAAQRINGWLERMRPEWVRSTGSVAYAGGVFRARVYRRPAPAHFPTERPYYC